MGYGRRNLAPADEHGAEERYGAPQLTIHRADLLARWKAMVPRHHPL
jgi:hypothetical protein